MRCARCALAGKPVAHRFGRTEGVRTEARGMKRTRARWPPRGCCCLADVGARGRRGGQKDRVSRGGYI